MTDRPALGAPTEGSFITDREGGFEWTVPSDELFRFHLAQVREPGGFLLARRLYETMLVWETLRRCMTMRPGPRSPTVTIGGAGLAAAAIVLGLVDELRMFRYPVVVGGGTPFCRRSPKPSRSS